MFKRQLRESPFAAPYARGFRQALISANLDRIFRKVLLGQANGLTGKTVTHPAHLAAVHALSVVAQEHFSDASATLGDEVAGLRVMRSEYTNEEDLKPHRAWAERILRKAHLFGVAAGGVASVALLEASIHAADCGAAAAEKVSA